jgi:hypothetical protein
MEPNWQKSRNQTFRRVVMRDGEGKFQIVEIADYEEYMNARPDFTPLEAEIKVQDDEALRNALSRSPGLRGELAVAAELGSKGEITREQALKELNNMAKTKRGLFQRFLDLFNR